jgi:hypothetical protein
MWHEPNVQSTRVVELVISGRQPGQVVFDGAAEIERHKRMEQSGNIGSRDALKKPRQSGGSLREVRDQVNE